MLALALAVVTGLPLLLTTTTAAFTGTTTSGNNSFAAATLQAPTGFSVTQSCSGASINATLSWTPTASTWADGYAWQRTLAATTTAEAVVAGQATSTTLDATVLAASTTYQYQLRATAGAWRSAAATATLTTTGCGGVQVADVTWSSTAAATTAISVNKPATTMTGDLLIDYVADAGTVAVTPDQAGWTAVRSDQSLNAWITQSVWYRWAGASEPASYSFTKSNPKADMVAAVLRVTGANATTPFDASAGNGQGSQVSTSIIAPSVTTTVPNTLLVTFASTTDGNTYTPAAGMTERVDFTSGRWMSEQIATQPIAAAGATGTRTITINDIGNVYAVATTLTIRP